MRLILLGLMFLALGCGKSNNAGGNLGGPTAISGTSWQGNFSPAAAGGNLKNSMKVRLEFHKDQTFVANQIGNISASARGKYTDLPKHKNLIMDIQDSSFEDFGKKDQTYEFEYSMEGEELQLKGNNGRYLLTKDGGSEDEEQKSVLDGNWECRPGDRSHWRINVSGLSFRASKSANNQQTIFFEGEVSILKKNDAEVFAKLTVKSSNASKITGSMLSAHANGNKLKLEQIDDKGKRLDNTRPVDCNRR